MLLYFRITINLVANVLALEVQGLEWLLVPTRILLDMRHAVLAQCDTAGAVKIYIGY